MNIHDHNWRVLVAAAQSDRILPMGVVCVLADFMDDPMTVPAQAEKSQAYLHAEKELRFADLPTITKFCEAKR